MWERRCAPNTQHSSQTMPSAPTTRSDQSRWPAATRVTRRSARIMRASSATMNTTTPAVTKSALVRPIEARSVSIPVLA